MAIVTGDRYIEELVKFVDVQAGPLIDGAVVLKLNPAGLHYVQLRLESLHELENLLSGAPVDYLRAYVSDLGDYRKLEQLRRILRLLTSLKVVSVLPPPTRDPTPLCLLPFERLKVLELRGCDLSTSAAKGLLELRHTLEKIICHNSTDALRHVFASRIAEIKGSPQWNRLSFVSCACNRLILMDESLQLLPAVETLDLSRNRFAKVDNLRKCTKLKHLDLGFNHLRSIAPFTEVSCHLVKLVLRNNALTTLCGLENLKSLEGLDVSYNIISNFLELEFLTGLPTLRNLWLEGNPLCCARWYRAQVFSYFANPDMLKLDDKEISTREFWKRQLIIARRQKKPASFGFYSPAKDGAEGGGSIDKKKRRVSRLASIESEEESTYFSSDQESPSGDKEIQSKEEIAISDDEAEIVDLINRVELMKKERSILWLREFKEWMDHESEDFVEGSSYGGPMSPHLSEKHLKSKIIQKHYCESSRYGLDSLQTSGDETSTNVFESDNSFVETSTVSQGGIALPGMERFNLGQLRQKSYSHEGFSSDVVMAKCSHVNLFTVQRDHKIVENGSISPLTTIDDTTESHGSSTHPVSPPHYREDILHRRHNLVEEILQLSAKSYSMASSDSETSSSEDDLDEYGNLTKEVDESQMQYSNPDVGRCFSLNSITKYDQGHVICRENDRFSLESHGEKTSSAPALLDLNSNDLPVVLHDVEIDHVENQGADVQEKRKNRRKSKRRVIPLLQNVDDKAGLSKRSNGNITDTCGADMKDEQEKQTIHRSDFQEKFDKEKSEANMFLVPAIGNVGDEFIEEYFNATVADSKVNETCRQYMRCDCVLEPESLYREREVALLRSSENKLYVLLVGLAFDGSGRILSLLGWHRVEDVREVLVGIGLQVVRVHIDKGPTYMFLTRSIEKSRQLLCTLEVFGPYATNEKCSFRSLEQVQVELFEKQICGGTKLSIFQYSMVLFRHNNNEEQSWLSRSLIVGGGCVLVCVEDLKRFSSPSVDASSPPYFALESCGAICDVSELVIETKESRCITLSLKWATTKFCPPSRAHKEVANDKKSTASGPVTWKLKWFSEESLFNFVALLKAIHSGMTMSPLIVRCV